MRAALWRRTWRYRGIKKNGHELEVHAHSPRSQPYPGMHQKKKKKKGQAGKGGGDFPFYPALGKLYLEYCIQAWSPQCRKPVGSFGAGREEGYQR